MSDPSQPAGSGKKPLDLKSRLGLKSGSTSSKPAGSSPLPPPPSGHVLPPPPSATPEGPTEASIEEARQRAAALAADAGPAEEEFSIGGAPERTPVPEIAPGGVRIEYVEVGGGEISPEIRKRNRIVLVAAIAITALLAFFLGRALSSSDALNTLRENRIAEANEKLRSFDANQPLFEGIASMTADLRTFNTRAAAVESGQVSLLDLEDDVAGLLGNLKTFVDNKTFVDPGFIIGRAVYNGDLIAKVLNYAIRTQTAHSQAAALLEEAQTLVAMWRPVPEDKRVRLVFADTEEQNHPELGELTIGKGRLIRDIGPPAKVDLVDSNGRVIGQEYQQMVLLEGEEDPIQVKTAQVSKTDLGPFFDDSLNQIKAVSIGRLASLTQRLQKTLEGCDPTATKNAILEFLEKSGVSPGNRPKPTAPTTSAPATPAAPEPAADEDKAEEPAADEDKAEEPAADEDKAEEPAADEDKAESDDE